MNRKGKMKSSWKEKKKMNRITKKMKDLKGKENWQVKTNEKKNYSKKKRTKKQGHK